MYARLLDCRTSMSRYLRRRLCMVQRANQGTLWALRGKVLQVISLSIPGISCACLAGAPSPAFLRTSMFLEMRCMAYCSKRHHAWTSCPCPVTFLLFDVGRILQCRYPAACQHSLACERSGRGVGNTQVCHQYAPACYPRRTLHAKDPFFGRHKPI
jgi:hypothetical protein